MGQPVLGSGEIFSVDWETVLFDPATLTPPLMQSLFKVFGLDFGISHPFAAYLIGWDRETDIIYVLDGFQMSDATPIQHVPRMVAICANAPVAWPHDGHARDKGSGIALIEQYKKPLPGMRGLNVLPDHAQHDEGGYSTEVSIAEMQQRFETGRLRISNRLTQLIEQCRNYHRDEKGLIVQRNDDSISAVRIAIMARKSAKLVKLGDQPASYGQNNWKLHYKPSGNDFDLFTGKPFDDDDDVVGREWIGSQPPDPVTGLRWDHSLERWVK
jgi:hypothetical protein